MSQQINLLPPPPEAPLLSARVLPVFPVLALLVMLGWCYTMWQANERLARDVEAQRARVAEARKLLDELRIREGARRKPEEVAAEVAKLMPIANVSREVLERFGRGEFGSLKGYMEQLTLLARLAPEDVWLTGVDIDALGTRLNLSGKALGSEAVVSYAQGLNAAFEPLGVRFSSVEITRQAPKSGEAAAEGPAVAPVEFKVF